MATISKAAEHWSSAENASIIADYLDMLEAERAGNLINKAAHNRSLQKLTGRSAGSIEFKHCNISFVMHELRFPSIDGYQPRSNVQAALFEQVARAMQDRPVLNELVRVQSESQSMELVADGLREVKPPRREKGTRLMRESASERITVVRPAIDFLEREARNRRTGDIGESMLLAFEERRLRTAGKKALAARIEHVAAIHLGHGYDIRSFELDGEPRLIEVKTTTFGRYTPIFVSRNEHRVSQAEASRYLLARVFDCFRAPRFFSIRGAFAVNWDMEPTQFEARLR